MFEFYAACCPPCWALVHGILEQCMLWQSSWSPSILIASALLSRSVSRSMASSSLEEVLRVKRLSENAILPMRGSAFAAGFDLFSAVDTVVPKNGKALIPTNIAIEIPPDTYARIAPRSGLAWKHFIDTGAGVVDYDYRGDVGVILFNHNTEDFYVKKGDRVAQLILERISMASCIEVEELGSTERGAGGFGSTGENVLKRVKTNDENTGFIIHVNTNP